MPDTGMNDRAKGLELFYPTSDYSQYSQDEGLHQSRFKPCSRLRWCTADPIHGHACTPFSASDSQRRSREGRGTATQTLVKALAQEHAPGRFDARNTGTTVQVQTLAHPGRTPERAGKIVCRHGGIAAAINDVRPCSPPCDEAGMTAYQFVIVFRQYRQLPT